MKINRNTMCQEMETIQKRLRYDFKLSPRYRVRLARRLEALNAFWYANFAK
jgi:hypothetical protein